MNCKRAKANIALWVGDDLEDVAEHELRQHLSECADCHEHSLRMKSCLHCLRNPDDLSVPTVSESVWPDLAVRLPSRDSMWTRGNFNGWVPAALIAASCLVILYSAFQTPFRNQPYGESTVEMIPAVWPSPGSNVIFDDTRDVNLRIKKSEWNHPLFFKPFSGILLNDGNEFHR